MQDVPKIVLKGLQSPPAESHPEADLLTAFAEHALVGRERDRIVEHLARCGDCRDVVMLALPATETLAPPAPSGGRITWLSWPVLRWGVVAAGILAVTSIGVLQYMRDHQEKIVASNSMHRYAAADTTAQNAPVLPQAPASSSCSQSNAEDAERLIGCAVPPEHVGRARSYPARRQVHRSPAHEPCRFRRRGWRNARRNVRRNWFRCWPGPQRRSPRRHCHGIRRTEPHSR